MSSARPDDSADADRRGNGARRGFERRGGDRFDQSHRGEFGVLGAAIRQHQRELIAGVPRDEIVGAKIGGQARGQPGDHLVAGVVTIGAVEDEKILKRDEHHREGFPVALRLVENPLHLLGQMRAVQGAGQRVELRLPRQSPFVVVPLGHDPHDAMRARRPPVHALEPATRVFEPDRAGAADLARRDDRVGDLIEHARALVGAFRFNDLVVAGGRAFRGEQRSERHAGRQIDLRQGGEGPREIFAPAQPIGYQIPIVDHLADRIENGARIDALRPDDRGRLDRFRGSRGD
jgi:hypothetical protein